MIKKIKEYYKRRKLLNRYKKKKINPKLYGIVDVMAIQPMTAPVSGTFHLEFVYRDENTHKNLGRLIKIIEE